MGGVDDKTVPELTVGHMSEKTQRLYTGGCASEVVIKHPDRAEAERFYNFPYEAFEEALTNAVYHRGYDEREPIELRISPEEIVIVNYPGPDRSVRLDQLRQGKAVPRRYRNRRIGDFPPIRSDP